MEFDQHLREISVRVLDFLREVEDAGAYERLLSAVEAALQDAPDRDTARRLSSKMMSIGRTGYEASADPVADMVLEANAIVRDAGLGRLRDEYDRGEREFIWPPPEGCDWNHLRVLVATFVDRKVDAEDWPPILLADRPTSLSLALSPYEMLHGMALEFVSMWIHPDTRDERFAEHEIEARHRLAWEEFLELPGERHGTAVRGKS